MTQLDMFTPPNRSPKAAAKVAKRVARMQRPTIDQRFEAFHLAHPHVFTEMLRLARKRLADGEKRIAVKALWEDLRVSLESDGPDPGHPTFTREYKLNNDFTAIYARKLIERAPELGSVIELRKRKSP